MEIFNKILGPRRPLTPKFSYLDKLIEPRKYFEMKHGKVIRNKYLKPIFRKRTKVVLN